MAMFVKIVKNKLKSAEKIQNAKIENIFNL